MLKSLKSIGPAALVTAAFIGPGTVTACTLAGANYGFALLWALLFSIIATIVLQEMSARLGIIGRKGLGDAIRESFPNGLGRILSLILIISAIAIGNAAYETGNILGGALGIDAIAGLGKEADHSTGLSRLFGPIIGLIAFILLLIGNYKTLEKILVGLVITMSIVFIITMLVLSPDWEHILKGMFLPRIPKGSMLVVAGLIGTTVVPYNLFLHSSLVLEKWKRPEDLKNARSDIWISIILGGIVSIAIVITSASAFFGTGSEIKNAADLATQIEPVLGNWATIFIGTGLFAAGLTSAMTAPLAAAYATAGIMGWGRNLKSTRFRAVWMFILLIGILLSALGLKPVPAILFAQAANGILLPIVAIYLLVIMNNKNLLGNKRNSLWMNMIGGSIVLVTVFLGIKSLLSVFGII